ncbi:patatin-like phospholipase family protein [Plebeiibacterium marinum]|uniref:Patatin family protein n=1 Tax=Plebeiibacterium marinum TaxID=2992111 RepID=A0AAE3MG94_9BACT|nr:patatin family protein [Plebeiobacterium marinum]MCW3807014.1 patatin family protein [Plebeiobacterium marinum]
MSAKIGLVLEGGGFRGLYSAGVVDCFLKNNIDVPYVIGVSMGACNGVNYISKQPGRNLSTPYTYVNDKRYISLQRLFTKGELFGMDFIFKEIPDKLIPFDYDTFYSSDKEFVVVTTDCITGKPFYISDFKHHTVNKALQASTSLPFASKIVDFQGKKLLDGGICNPVPITKAFDDGCDKLIVVLTQPQGFIKPQTHFNTIGKLFYKNYPDLLAVLNNRHQVYNNQLRLISELEKEGKAFVFRPKSSIPVGRTERNKNKLKEAYNMGFMHSEELLPDLKEWMSR